MGRGILSGLRPIDLLPLVVVLPVASACAVAPAKADEPASPHPVVMDPARPNPPPELPRIDNLAGTALSPSDEAQAPRRCTPDMVLASTSAGDFCIDRFEGSIERRAPSGARRIWPGNLRVEGLETDIVAVSLAGRKPQGYISLLQARRACENAGKRLCSSAEWVAACRGPDETLYPYGNERKAQVCNDRFSGQASHPVVRLFRQFAAPGSDPKSMWTDPWLNDPRLHELSDTVSPAGAFSGCTNGYGVSDMVGNLHEWVDDAKGVFRGGYFMDTHLHGEGCEYRTTVHGPKYHDYSTGFRCCAEAATSLD